MEFIKFPKEMKYRSFRMKKNCAVTKRTTMSSSSLRRNRFHQQAERNVFRLKNSMPEKFRKIMLKYLADATDMKIHDIELQATRKTPERANVNRKSSILFCKKSIKKKDVTHLTSETIAALTTLIDFIGKSYNITSEGLFRKTGNLTRQKSLRKQIMDNSNIDFEIISSHDGANVLKNFIRDLPEPLLTNQFRNIYHHLASSLSSLEKSRAITLKVLQLLVLLLPGDNYCLLRSLMALLHRTSKTAENLMSASSLALMFTPQFFCSNSVSGNELQATTSKFAELVTFMIEHGSNLFKIPLDLADEVSNFWKEMEIPNHLYMHSITKKNRPLKTFDDSVLVDSPGKTTKKTARRSLVHVIDLGISPDKRRKSGIFSPRRRQSSESSDASLPERRPLPDIVFPQSDDNNINDDNMKLEPINWNFPSTIRKDKPVAMVKPFTRSPISQFFRSVPQQIQKVMQTPRSRPPMPYQSPQGAENINTDDEVEIMV